MPSNEPLSPWAEEREETQKKSQGYSLCNLQERSHLSKLLLEIFHDRIVIQNFCRDNVADFLKSMCSHSVNEETATQRGVMVFQGQQQPNQFYPYIKGQSWLPPAT